MNTDFRIMLYTDDIELERAFWEAIGFVIEKDTEVLGYPSFDMKVNPYSNCGFTVYPMEFIRTYSPDLAVNQPNLLFTSSDIVALYERVAQYTDAISELNTLPYKNFNFMAPSGQFYTVREA